MEGRHGYIRVTSQTEYWDWTGILKGTLAPEVQFSRQKEQVP